MNNGALYRSITLFLLALIFCHLTFAEDKCTSIVALCKKSRDCNAIDKYMQNGKPVFSQEAIEIARKNLTDIVKVATANQIDPRALIGVVLAANTINPDSLAQKVQRKLGNNMDAPLTDGYFGITRIDIKKAMEVENSGYPKRWNAQSVLGGRSQADTAKDLRNNDYNALTEAAEHLRMSQAIYAEHHFNIENRPEILATLFATGGVKQRAIKSESAGREPKVNDWGALVICNSAVIHELLAATSQENKNRDGETSTIEKRKSPPPAK